MVSILGNLRAHHTLRKVYDERCWPSLIPRVVRSFFSETKEKERKEGGVTIRAAPLGCPARMHHSLIGPRSESGVSTCLFCAKLSQKAWSGRPAEHVGKQVGVGSSQYATSAALWRRRLRVVVPDPQGGCHRVVLLFPTYLRRRGRTVQDDAQPRRGWVFLPSPAPVADSPGPPLLIALLVSRGGRCSLRTTFWWLQALTTKPVSRAAGQRRLPPTSPLCTNHAPRALLLAAVITHRACTTCRVHAAKPPPLNHSAASRKTLPDALPRMSRFGCHPQINARRSAALPDAAHPY